MPARAGVTLDEAGRLSLGGDFRLRIEQDWDSQTAGGDERDDRARLRARARLNLGYTASESLFFGVQLASGSDASHQSPHITLLDFDDNDTGDAHFNLSKWYLQVKHGGFEGWAGRNGLPAWRPNEMLWDDDVTPVGVGLRYSFSPMGAAKLTLNGGYFALPVGMQTFSGNLGLGQLVLATETSGGLGLTFAAGAFLFEADDDDPQALLLRSGNGTRDYSIWAGHLQARTKLAGKALSFGVDVMTNTESYSATSADPFTAANHDQTEGYDAYLTWGSTGSRGDWLFGVWYAHIEALAVNASYAQDDWVRWGSATQTDSSDLEGFELRAAVGLGSGQNLVLRLYLVDAITTRQDGNRFRVDYNFSF